MLLGGGFNETQRKMETTCWSKIQGGGIIVTHGYSCIDEEVWQVPRNSMPHPKQDPESLNSQATTCNMVSRYMRIQMVAGTQKATTGRYIHPGLVAQSQPKLAQSRIVLAILSDT